MLSRRRTATSIFITTPRFGFTLVECAVAVAIIGLLAAISVPAIQSIREASRRASCQNHLHQFGVALAGFADVHEIYPTASHPVSPWRRLLPWFGERNLLDAIEASSLPGGPDLPNDALNVPAYCCPSDAVAQSQREGMGEASYYLNAGTRIRTPVYLSVAGTELNGYRKTYDVDLRPREVVDGQSNTMAMAERLVFELPLRRTRTVFNLPRRDFWFTVARYNQVGEEELAIDQCRNHRTESYPQSAGVWAPQLDGSNDYDHLLTPNHHGCYNGPEDLRTDWFDRLVPASSEHPGGVNGLLGDGSVRMVNESIDAGVWQAYGTRNGGESQSGRL